MTNTTGQVAFATLLYPAICEPDIMIVRLPEKKRLHQKAPSTPPPLRDSGYNNKRLLVCQVTPPPPFVRFRQVSGEARRHGTQTSPTGTDPRMLICSSRTCSEMEKQNKNSKLHPSKRLTSQTNKIKQKREKKNRKRGFTLNPK